MLSSLDRWGHHLDSADEEPTGQALHSNATVIWTAWWAIRIPWSPGYVSWLAHLKAIFSNGQDHRLTFLSGESGHKTGPEAGKSPVWGANQAELHTKLSGQTGSLAD